MTWWTFCRAIVFITFFFLREGFRIESILVTAWNLSHNTAALLCFTTSIAAAPTVNTMSFVWIVTAFGLRPKHFLYISQNKGKNKTKHAISSDSKRTNHPSSTGELFVWKWNETKYSCCERSNRAATEPAPALNQKSKTKGKNLFWFAMLVKLLLRQSVYESMKLR